MKIVFELIDKEDYAGLEKLLNTPDAEYLAEEHFLPSKEKPVVLISPISQTGYAYPACDFIKFVDYAIATGKPNAFGILLRTMIKKNLPIGRTHIESIVSNIKNISSKCKPVEFFKQIPIDFNYQAIMNSLISEIFYSSLNLYDNKANDFFLPFKTSIEEIMHWIIQHSGIELRSILRTLIHIRGREKVVLEFIQFILKVNQEQGKLSLDELFNSGYSCYFKGSCVVLAFNSENYEILKWLLSLNLQFDTDNYKDDLFKILNALTLSKEFNAEIFTLLFHKYGGIDKIKNQDPSLLEYTILSRNIEATECLLSLGFKLTDTLPNKKETYLQVLLSRGDWREKSPNFVFYFLKKHLDINDPKTFESVSLPELCRKKHFAFVTHLLSLKRDPNECDESGITAIDVLRDHINKKDPDIIYTSEELREIEKLHRELSKFSDITFVHDVPQLPEIHTVATSNCVDLWPVYYLHWQRTQSIDLEFRIAQDHLEFLKKNKIEFRQCRPEHDLLEPKKPTLIHSDAEILAALKSSKKSFLSSVMNLISPDSSYLFERLKQFPRFKDFVSQAEWHWSQSSMIQDVLRSGTLYANVKYGEQPAKFEFDNFKLNYVDFRNKTEFSNSLKALLDFMDTDFGKKISGSLSYQTVSHHTALLWSLSNRHRNTYFQKKLQMFKNFKKVSFGDDITLNFMDFTHEEDYNFMVHTTSTLPENLEPTLESGADFIRSTHFFSCSIVDKDTPAAVMTHQDNTYVNNGKLLFPISLILDLADDAVIKAFYVDAWSPMLSKNKDRAKELAEDYLQKLARMKTVFNEVEYLTRTATTQTHGTTSTSLSHLDSDFILGVMAKNPHYKVPNSVDVGFLPDLTPLQVLKQTKSHYNEILVAGKKKNKIVGILVEESALNEFCQRFAADIKLAAEHPSRGITVEKIKASLKLLAQSKYPLILVKTNPNCFASKGSPYDKHKSAEESFVGSMRKVEQTMLRHHRLKKSKFNEKQPTVVAAAEMSLKSALLEIETHRQSLTVLQEEILGQQKIDKAMVAKPKVRV